MPKAIGSLFPSKWYRTILYTDILSLPIIVSQERRQTAFFSPSAWICKFPLVSLYTAILCIFFFPLHSFILKTQRKQVKLFPLVLIFDLMLSETNSFGFLLFWRFAGVRFETAADLQSVHGRAWGRAICFKWQVVPSYMELNFKPRFQIKEQWASLGMS